MSSDPDRLLVEQAKLNDQAAFEALWRRHSLRIAGMVRVLLAGSNHALSAQDTVLEIFRKAFSAIHKFSGKNGAKFSTWLHDIARNHCIDILRKKKREYVDADEALRNVPNPGQGPDQVLELKERADAAWTIMDERERRFIEILEEGHDYEEAAKILNIQVVEIYKMTRTIRQKLEKLETLAQTRSGE